MRNHNRIPNRRERPLALLIALGVACCGGAPASAQSGWEEPVEELRLILKAPLIEPCKRDHSLREQLRTLESLGDLGRALILREWRDDDPDQRAAAVDRSNRLVVARRFEQAVREVFRYGDEASCLAVLNMLAEIGVMTHGVGTNYGIARDFGPDLVQLMKQGEAGTRAAAARTLGRIDPEPGLAISALAGALSCEDPRQRLAAADGLLIWLRTVAHLAMHNRVPSGVEVTQHDLVTVGRSVVTLAARGLGDYQPEVRRRCAEAVGQAAAALRKSVLASRATEAMEDSNESHQQVEQECAALLPLILALKDQGPALTRALADADEEVRLLAARALEDMTDPQLRWLQRAAQVSYRDQRTAPAIVRPSGFRPNPSPSGDLLLEGLHETVLALAAGLTVSDAGARRTALEVLETLGPDAAPATPELVAALADPDRFVRWAAARTLGKMGPVEEEAVVPALARLLTDNDLDVRLAAATALERYGPAAAGAIPDLCRTVGATDAELRAAAVRALGAIGGAEAQLAVPDLMVAVADPDARVRQTAARALGKFGPAARAAVPALREAMQDRNPDVQQAAGEALLNILRPARTRTIPE